MDKRKNSEEIDRNRYDNYLAVKDLRANEILTSKQIQEILKECDIPTSYAYLSRILQTNMFVRVAANKYKFNQTNFNFNDFAKTLRDSRNYWKEKKEARKQKIVPLNEQQKEERFVKELLKTGRYRIQKLIQVPVTIMEDRWVDVKEN